MHAYTFDAENKILKVDTVAAYTYDGEGQRVRKLVGENLRFIYGIGGQEIAEFSGASGALQKEYIYGASGLLATIEPTAVNSNGTRYTTSDNLGTPRVVTNSYAGVVSRHDYKPFGEEIGAGIGSRTTSIGYSVADGVRQRFTSKERDVETGLDYFLARYYANSQGRFTSPDDFRNDTEPDDPQGWNLYMYGRNSPLIFVDPTGTMTDFVDNATGRITTINDGKDQVIATTTETISCLVQEANTSAYNNDLGVLEQDQVANLHMTRQQFVARAATTYAESSWPWAAPGSELANEMKAIAWVNTRNHIAFGANSPAASRFKNTAFGSQDAKMQLANLAIVNQVQGGPDPSNGAVAWDGMEQAQYPASDTRPHIPNPHGPGTWQLHQNSIGWDISNADYAKWKQNVGRSFRAPQISRTANGQIGYHSTAVWFRTIFWRR